jgi:hypothetical protein
MSVCFKTFLLFFLQEKSKLQDVLKGRKIEHKKKKSSQGTNVGLVGLVGLVLGVGWCTLLGCWIDLTINPSTHQPINPSTSAHRSIAPLHPSSHRFHIRTLP